MASKNDEKTDQQTLLQNRFKAKHKQTARRHSGDEGVCKSIFPKSVQTAERWLEVGTVLDYFELFTE